MPRTPSARRPLRSAGQSVYEVMLIIACAAMLLAVILAAQEYFSFYQGPAKPDKFESAAAASAAPMPAAKAPGAGRRCRRPRDGAAPGDDRGVRRPTPECNRAGAGDDALN